MAATAESPTNFPTVVSALSVSKARLKRRKSTKREFREDVDAKDTSIREASIPDERTVNDNSVLEMIKEEEKEPRLEEFVENKKVKDTNKERGPEKKEPSGEKGQSTQESERLLSENGTHHEVVCIKVGIDHAAPLKAKLLALSLAVRVTFINELTGVPVKKSSQQISAVSYYENQQNLDYVMPVMSRPATILCDRKGQLVANWSEEVVFCETQEHLLCSEHVALLLELLVLPKTAQSPYQIAWGLILPSRVPLDQVLPVQLYQVPRRLRGRIKSSDLVGIRFPAKYPSILYTKLSLTDLSTLPMEPGQRSLLPTLPEVSHNDYTESYSLRKKLRGSLGSLDSVDGSSSPSQWSRLPGQPCSITDSLHSTLPGGDGGCSTLAFSPSGRFLASACISGNQTTIKIFQVESLSLECVCSLPCGVGMMYQCVWSHDETRLACASGNGLCHLWVLTGDDDGNEQLLPHPSFVYTLQWILDSSVLVTGCYDGAIRCWRDGKLVEVVLASRHRINTLCNDSSSNRLYSGSGGGSISVWSICETTADTMLKQVGALDLPEIRGNSVQKIVLLPGQQRMLVHAIATPYLIVDLRLGSTIVSLQDDDPIVHPNALCVTPCGKMILTNNTSSNVFCVWDVNKGSLVRKQNLPGVQGPLSSIAYHPNYHMAVFTAIGPNQRIVIMTNSSIKR